MTTSSTNVVASKAWSEGFPPAANWFQSQMLAASSNHSHTVDDHVTTSSTVAYGARNLVVIIHVPDNVQEEPPTIRTIKYKQLANIYSLQVQHVTCF